MWAIVAGVITHTTPLTRSRHEDPPSDHAAAHAPPPASIVLALGALTTVPAMASHGGEGVSRSGHCSGSSSWKLEAKGDDGRIEVEAEVDTGRSGQTWTWRILHNGGVSAHGQARTGPHGDSFSVERKLVNIEGTDAIGWRATNTVTHETCSGNLQF